jgi:hypothetical protein
MVPRSQNPGDGLFSSRARQATRKNGIACPQAEGEPFSACAGLAVAAGRSHSHTQSRIGTARAREPEGAGYQLEQGDTGGTGWLVSAATEKDPASHALKVGGSGFELPFAVVLGKVVAGVPRSGKTQWNPELGAVNVIRSSLIHQSGENLIRSNWRDG